MVGRKCYCDYLEILVNMGKEENPLVSLLSCFPPAESTGVAQ